MRYRTFDYYMYLYMLDTGYNGYQYSDCRAPIIAIKLLRTVCDRRINERLTAVMQH